MRTNHRRALRGVVPILTVMEAGLSTTVKDLGWRRLLAAVAIAMAAAAAGAVAAHQSGPGVHAVAGIQGSGHSSNGIQGTGHSSDGIEGSG